MQEMAKGCALGRLIPMIRQMIPNGNTNENNYFLKNLGGTSM